MTGAIFRASALVAVAAIALIAVGYRNAIQPPVVRNLTIRTSGYPAGAAPLRIVLFSDLHVHGPDMPPARVGRIVAQVNALHPDLDLIAGDFVGDNWVGGAYPVEDAVAPLAGLRARLGAYAVLGNNDYDAGAQAVAQALRQAGVHVLVNEARRVGPVALGGIDGKIAIPRPAWMDRRASTYAALERTPGVKLLLVHRPDEFHWAPGWLTLMLAGHTHCGQIVLPLIGPVETGSDFGRKYLCGIVRNGASELVVTAGLGTSHLPLRIGAPPDIWLVQIEGAKH